MRKLLLLVATILVSQFYCRAQISGVVYRDFNGNGTRQTVAPSIEPGAPGVVINAYDASNTLVATATSANDGSYSIPFTVPVRVEFVIPAGVNCVNTTYDNNGFGGDGNNVRFVSASTTLNYAVLHPDDYVANTNPMVFTPIFRNGNPTAAGTGTPQSNFFTGYTWNSNATPVNQINQAASAIGALYGVAYSKQAKRIFSSAFIKRHVGLGPLGSGGIYMLEATGTGFNVTNFYDMDANGYRTRAASSAPAYGSGTSYTITGNTSITFLGAVDPESGFPEGLGVVGTNTNRGLPVGLTTDSYDPAAFGQVGKVGLGDLDISDDGKFLFVMNLYSRKVYRLELDNAYNPTAVIAVTSYAVPAVPVTNGELRPFALGYYRGKLYVGAVASGENGGSNTVGGATDLYAHVLEMTDPTGAATFNTTPILTFPLNYQKGYPIQTLNTAANRKWFPWANASNLPVNDGNNEYAYSTPMLSDIDFTDNGDMVLDFFDRSGHQWGYRNFRDLSTTTTQMNLDVSGDALIAGRDCNTGAFTLESNGAYSSNGIAFSSPGAGNTQGPGGGEFFYQDVPPDNYHNETSMGSVAFLRGAREGIFTLMDANSAFAGGTGQFATNNAAVSNRVNIYSGSNNGTMEKANGLGDIEISGDEPPLEVGNRVWLDTDKDGIQDAGENGIANVSIELFCDDNNDNIPDGAAIATTTSDPEGYWYFNTSNVSDGDCGLAGNQAGPQPNKTYVVRIGSADWTGGLGTGDLNTLSLSLPNATVIGIPDASDNDATLVSTVPQIQMTTGKLGENNHSYDFGFKACSADAGPDIALNCSTPSGTIGTPAFPGDTYSWAPATGLNDPNIAQPTASPSSTTTYTLTVNGLCSDQVTVTVDNTPPTADAGSDATINCSVTSTTIGTAAIGGNTYSWSPATGLNDPNIAQPTASPAATTAYTVTVTGTNGCTATDVVNVNVDTTPPVADAGADVNLGCVPNSGMIGTVAIGGNTYSWSPATGLNDPNIAQPTASPSTTTTYTVTVTGSNG
ncbi:MAG: hypothetical protein JNJ58_01815, partial [Chitinophagaceae bacterium]|nr:hypothetical protein [Chitinophagaceae bacterium]